MARGQRLHEFFRGDLAGLEAMVDAIEFQCRQVRALVSTMRMLADDVQTLEEEDPMAPGPGEG